MVEAAVGRTTSRLSAEERASIAAYAARATWPSGFVVYQRAASADGIFVVLRGRIVLRSRVRAGRGFVPGVACAGETFGAEGLAQNSRYATDARADEETETLHLSGARFRAFVREQPQHALRHGCQKPHPEREPRRRTTLAPARDVCARSALDGH